METPKRGRGRPRKSANIPIIPEEVIITNNQVDLSDLQNERIAPEAPHQETEEEVIHMAGDQEQEAPKMEAHEVETEVVAPQVVEAQAVPPQIVYLPAPEPVFDEAKEKARRHSALTKVKRYREAFEAVRAMRFSEDWSTDAIESHLEDIRIIISSRWDSIASVDQSSENRMARTASKLSR